MKPVFNMSLRLDNNRICSTPVKDAFSDLHLHLLLAFLFYEKTVTHFVETSSALLRHTYKNDFSLFSPSWLFSSLLFSLHLLNLLISMLTILNNLATLATRILSSWLYRSRAQVSRAQSRGVKWVSAWKNRFQSLKGKSYVISGTKIVFSCNEPQVRAEYALSRKRPQPMKVGEVSVLLCEDCVFVI